MQDLSLLLAKGCHFCRKPLTADTARLGTMSLKIVGTDVWSDPIPILCCEECERRELGSNNLLG